MRYTISQTLDKVNKILDKELEEPTWEDKMDWKEDDLFYDYNLAEVMTAEKVKVMEPTSE